MQFGKSRLGDLQVREELDAAMLEREKLSSTVSSLEERVRKLQRELEDSLSENM